MIMTTKSFDATNRFYDDKNYPRGFSRHGDYTIRESDILESYGQAFLDLELGKREAINAEEEAFVAVCKNERVAETIFEKTWIKYRSRTNHKKRVYTLSGQDSSSEGSDEFED